MTMIVKTNLKITLFCFLLTAFSSGLTQTLDQLKALQEIVEEGSILDGSDTLPQQKSIITNTKESREEKLDQERLEDGMINFGYSGTTDFLVAPRPKPINQKLKYFGYDYFTDQQLNYAPVSDIPVPVDYILGPGDEIKLILFGNNSKKYSLIVTRDGEIFLPEIGPISVAGLTFQNLKETIQETVDNQLIGTRVSLTLGTLRSINIFVLGEASQPGMYTVNSLSTLTNAIFKSGGVKVTGSLRDIQLKRNGRIISNFDFYQLLLNGDTSNDTRLMSGDVVFIPPITKQVGILGEIQRPRIYELMENENVEDLIRLSGTLKPTADINSIEIRRIDPTSKGYNLIDLDLEKTDLKDLLLEDGDTLFIDGVINRLNQAILISGHYKNPGFHSWTKGMKVLDLIGPIDDLLPNTDINYLLIKRQNNSNQEVEFLTINLQEIIKSPSHESNIFLEERDHLVFLPSLLTTNLIRTSNINDENEEQQKLGLLYVRQSLQNKNKPLISEEFEDSLEDDNESKYFNYSVYNYCNLKETEVLQFIESDTTNLNNKTINFAKFESLENYSYKLTQICRDKLLKPFIEFLAQAEGNAEKTVQIYGNISFPGKYPYTKNATLEDILFASGGLQGLTYLDEVEISRKSIRDKEIIESNFIVNAEEFSTTNIQVLDVINVKKYLNQFSLVSLNGEVYFPGVYPIAKNQTLLELIDRAGGLTKEANTKNIFMKRDILVAEGIQNFKRAKEELKKQILIASNNSDQDSNSKEFIEQLTILIDQEEPDPSILGLLVFDFDSIQSGSNNDIMLQDGDTITIPSTQQTVSVIGEVFAPNSHFFDKDFSVSDYIELSGGETSIADVDSTYLIKGNGLVYPLNDLSKGGFFRTNQSTTIEPGDSIVVPLLVKDFSTIKTASDVSQILYQMAIAAAAVNSF